MSRRIAWFTAVAIALAAFLRGPSAASAQQSVKLGAGDTLTISGFINATLFNNRGYFDFGQGQNAEWASVAQPGIDQGYFDGDIRNTRIRFDFSSGPVLGKWAPKATLEADFFGQNNGLPPFGDEQPQLRGRFAYVDLTNGRTTLRIGQFWSPMFGEVPVSVTHLAFPLGYGATGMVGWRFPGVFVYHDLTPGKPLTVQVQLALLKGSGLAVTNGIGSGEASGKPQFEARFNLAKRFGTSSWNGYVVYHVDNKDMNGVGVPGGALNGWGVETGHNFTSGKLTVHGNYYTGHNLGQQFGHITQGAGSNSAQQGRIQGWGAWAQAGYDLTPHWGVWFYYGMDQPDAAKYLQQNGVALLRQLSHDTDGLIRFRAGRYAIGLEYFRAVTRWSTGVRTADQYALSVLYSL
ncbi:MAG: hypothetical protein DMD37_13005 [Gemmatimonadetes bacterium]|nr:MAG: hypothetical protein DMD71_04845 [Gemmatimonadota bacterium]PYP61615.1 MAG: hypothetical protein DMD37_13005 [Gemmatimonadota bacterium]